MLVTRGRGSSQEGQPGLQGEGDLLKARRVREEEREDRIGEGTGERNGKGRETAKAKGTLPVELARFSSLP